MGYVIGCYTAGHYCEVAKRYLLPSVQSLGLSHAIREMSSLGGWVANGFACQLFIRRMCEEMPGEDLLFLDADAVVRSDPWPFLKSLDCDMAGYYLRGTELLTGTLYLPAGPRRVAIMDEWIAENRRYPHRWDQINLQNLLKRPDFACRFSHLPPEYCCIFDIQRRLTPDIVPVIEHFQASRQLRKVADSGGGGRSGNPLISVLTPAYRCQKYIDTCIRSIQAQTYSNWEMIVVDDGSDDRLGDVVRKFARKDSRLRLFRIKHGGTAVAYNEAVSHAVGEVLANQEADDWSEPDRFEKQMRALITEGADLVTCLMNRVRMTERGQVVIPGRTVGGTGMVPKEYCDPACRIRGPITGSIMAHRRVHEKVGGYVTHVDGRITYAADGQWLFRVLACDDPPFKWAHVPEELYNYRDHHGQVTKQGQDIIIQDHARFREQYAGRILARLEREEGLCNRPS